MHVYSCFLFSSLSTLSLIFCMDSDCNRGCEHNSWPLFTQEHKLAKRVSPHNARFAPGPKRHLRSSQPPRAFKQGAICFVQTLKRYPNYLIYIECSSPGIDYSRSALYNINGKNIKPASPVDCFKITWNNILSHAAPHKGLTTLYTFGAVI